MTKSKTSKYPPKDSRRFFEYRAAGLDWDSIYEMVESTARLTREYLTRRFNQSTFLYHKKICLKPLLRYSMDFLGEKNGYIISALALTNSATRGRVDWGKQGLCFMEHLVPVDQCASELVEDPSRSAVERLYSRQRIAIMHRDEQRVYDGKNSPFGSRKFRTDREIEDMLSYYNALPCPDHFCLPSS